MSSENASHFVSVSTVLEDNTTILLHEIAVFLYDYSTVVSHGRYVVSNHLQLDCLLATC